MKITRVIETLLEIKAKFGDIAITGGYMHDNIPLSEIIVTDKEGHEIWPFDPNGLYRGDKKPEVDGVFLS